MFRDRFWPIRGGAADIYIPLFGHTSRTISYAKELTSVVSICYSQGNGFDTPLSRLLRNSVHANELFRDGSVLVLF